MIKQRIKVFLVMKENILLYYIAERQTKKK